MNLLLRFLWMWLAAHMGRRRELMGEHRLSFRCWPHDLDFNMHLTNSRYHSFMDLSRVDMMLRSGAWQRLQAKGFFPVLGSSSIRFRRAVKPLQRFDVTARILSWDEKWIYIEHRVIAGGDVAAIALVKAAFLDKAGRVPVERLLHVMGYDGLRPAFPAVLAKKDELDAALVV